MSTDVETPEQRITRWEARDAIVGLDAEVRQLQATLNVRDTELTTVRERCDQLANRITQLEIERDALRHRVAATERTPLSRRIYRKARSVAGRVVHH
jgi:regulator of replication initiation timing